MIKEELNNLKNEDINSLILFALYKLKDNPKYSTLSELSYIMDKSTLFTFLEYFGGMNITIPTLQEFKLMVNALLLYEYVELEGIDMDKALKEVCQGKIKEKDLLEVYSTICEVVSNYDFKR